MKKQVLRGVILGALATMTAGVSTMAQADGTASLDLTVNANITAGTCSASVLDGETATDTIAFGNVYISEVFAKTKVKSFKLRFSDCAGLKDKKPLWSLRQEMQVAQATIRLTQNLPTPPQRRLKRREPQLNSGQQIPRKVLTASSSTAVTKMRKRLI